MVTEYNPFKNRKIYAHTNIKINKKSKVGWGMVYLNSVKIPPH